MKLNPLNSRVIIEPIKADDKSSGGVILPETMEEDDGVRRGKVLEVGPGWQAENGDVTSLTVKVGDTVLYSQGRFYKTKLNDKQVLIIRESDILATVTE